MGAEGGVGDSREDSLASANQTLKRLSAIKRSYNLDIKLMSDPASKVCMWYL